VQCREKWSSCLDPTVNAAPYAQEEDARLQAVVRAMLLQAPSSSSTAAVTGAWCVPCCLCVVASRESAVVRSFDG
jgi:hypothetical protein